VLLQIMGGSRVARVVCICFWVMLVDELMKSWRLDITLLMEVDTGRDEVTPRCVVRPKLAHVDLLDVSESNSERRGLMDLKLRCSLL
jgi:hypothetical protein